MLISEDISMPVLKMEIMGIHQLAEDDAYTYIRAGAGENWHSFVLHTIALGLGGLENLSLIPGTVGASPIQNIGAYGVEMKDCVHRVRAYLPAISGFREFDHDECQFAYRSSIFKLALKGQAIITAVEFRLKKAPHTLSLSYGAILSELHSMGVSNPNIADVSSAVINIRRSKLPDPTDIGNTGSFFKNPEIDAALFNNLISVWPTMPHWKLSDGRVKLSAAWLIESAGWKGKRKGDVSMYERHALVLVNYGNATGPELWSYALEVIASVDQMFGLRLEPEVNIIGAAF
jgi:UDP-N-acetylmuramate dehydrogenase